MVLEGDKCGLPRDGGQGSQNVDYGVERRERETGMDENTSGLREEAIADEPNGDEACGGRKKKIGKSNWKRNQVLGRRENGDEYLGRSKKSDKIPVRSLGRRCLRKKPDTNAWGLLMMTERRSSNTSGASPGNRKENS